MSYNGRIDFGLVADYDALPDLDDLAAALEGAIAELAAAAGVAGKPRSRRRARRAARLTDPPMAGPLAPLTLALAQVDPRVGDLEGNARLVREHIAAPRDAGAELVLFPELVLTGYPPEDLLLKEHFLQAAQEALDDDRARRRMASSPSSATRSAPRTSTTRSRSSPTAASRRPTARRACGTTAWPTSRATSRPARAPRCSTSAPRGSG